MHKCIALLFVTDVRLCFFVWIDIFTFYLFNNVPSVNTQLIKILYIFIQKFPFFLLTLYIPVFI